MRVALSILILLFTGCSRQSQNTTILLEEITIVKIQEYRTGLDLNKWIYENKHNTEYIERIFEKVDLYTNSRAITESIFKHSIRSDVPVGLALGLAWSESRFNPRAINGIHNSNKTKDYGLFQLNDGYRDWTIEKFFDVDSNSKEGIEHLAEMLDKFDGKEVLAIGAYNSGATGVKRGVGYSTLVHIENVLGFKKNIEAEINEVMIE